MTIDRRATTRPPTHICVSPRAPGINLQPTMRLGRQSRGVPAQGENERSDTAHSTRATPTRSPMRSKEPRSRRLFHREPRTRDRVCRSGELLKGHGVRPRRWSAAGTRPAQGLTAFRRACCRPIRVLCYTWPSRREASLRRYMWPPPNALVAGRTASTRSPLPARGKGMAKSTTRYWNPLASENQGRWTPVTGLEGWSKS